MRILEMTASFGCLDHETLRLEEGVNLLLLPNEQGKSTWAAFITAMFYGIDTTQRTTRDSLPDKTRYLPWNGSPMEGTMTLEQKDRTVVLQRTTVHGRAMGNFCAYDRDTGLIIPELTGENCGQRLLGVERSVFLRSAMLRGSELTVSQDNALAQRLENLAASGSEADSYPAAETRLRSWKNRCSRPRSGQISRVEEEIVELDTKLDEIRILGRQRQALQEKTETVLQQLSERREAARQLAEELEAKTAGLPTAEKLAELALRLERSAELPEEDGCPAALQGLTAGELLTRAEKDLRTYDCLAASRRKRSGLWIVLAMIALLSGIVFLIEGMYLFAIPAFVIFAAATAGFGITVRYNGTVEREQEEAEAILRRYGAETRDQVLLLASERKQMLLRREQEKRLAAEIISEVQKFAPSVQTWDEACEAVHAGQRLRQRAEKAGFAARWELQPESDPIRQIAEWNRQMDVLRGRQTGMGDYAVLSARREECLARRDELRQKDRAMTLALAAMEEANTELTGRYAPHLTELAGTVLAALTDRRYDGMMLQTDLRLTVRERASGLMRPLAALSQGTRDQAWLALRLAMTVLLLPPDVPLIFDDVFLTFDQTRTAAAMEVLRNTGRQVIVFSCRKL